MFFFYKNVISHYSLWFIFIWINIKKFSVLISHLIQKTAKDISDINKSFLRSLITFKSIFKPLRTTGLIIVNYVNLIPGSGRSPGVGNGNPLQYSFLENFMDGEAWRLQSTGSQKESDTTERLSTHTNVVYCQAKKSIIHYMTFWVVLKFSNC